MSNEEDKVIRLEDVKEPLFGEKYRTPEASTESLTTSAPTQLSQHIYDKLYPYFTTLFAKIPISSEPLVLDADFYIKLAEAIRVEQWSDMCSIKLWILLNKHKAQLVKIAGIKWSDLCRTAKDIHKKVQADFHADAGSAINSFTCPRGQWIDYDKGSSKPRTTVENCIVALRFILEDDKLQLQYDTWKRSVIVVWPSRPTSTEDVYDPSPDNTDVIIKEWQNRIHEKHGLTFSDEVMRIARFRIAVKNQIHSQIDYYKSLKWDGVSRIAMLAKDIFRLQGTALELEVLRMQLIASVRRVLLPGTKYDLVPCLVSKQGVMKSFGLSVLYRTHNVLDEDILDLNSQKQSEKMRNGKNCLELPDSFGRNADYDTIKAFVSRRHDHGRDAYGRVEDIKDVGRTYVIWHAGNNPKLFRDPTGNRRFIPMPIFGEIDERLLRQVRDQIWAEAVELEKVGRLAYYDKMRSDGVPVEEGDEKFPDIMLDPKFYDDAALLQSEARVDNEYLEMVADVIFQSFVHFDERKMIQDGKETITSVTIYVLSEDIRLHLGVSPGQWNRASQKVAEAMQALIVLSKSEYDEFARAKIAGHNMALQTYPEVVTRGQKKENEWYEAHQSLSQDIKWIKPPGGIKRDGQPLRGYRIDFEPTYKTKDSWLRDYEIFRKFILDHNAIDNSKILRKDRPF
jgi:predicted P-loop ATPase